MRRGKVAVPKKRATFVRVFIGLYGVGLLAAAARNNLVQRQWRPLTLCRSPQLSTGRQNGQKKF